MLDIVTEDITGSKNRWTQQRCAFLGYLLGQGWDAKRISNHPFINSTANNVHRQAQRFGLSFREAVTTNPLKLKGEHKKVFEDLADKRGMTYELFIQYILITLAKEPTLITNILDDGE